jgi:putative N6-adenine-specific DNA methylase
MKESLAAGLVMLAGWNYKTPFIDPCTGSGTLAIEAAMIARNQAPGLMRNFDFERFHDFDPALLEAEKTAAREKEFKKSFTIIASDNDPIILEVARRNAELA